MTQRNAPDHCTRRRGVVRRSVAAVSVALVVSSLAQGVDAAPGDSDPTFGRDGRAVLAGGRLLFDTVPTDLLVHTDGRLLTTSIGESTFGVGVMTMYERDGRRDASFGRNGTASARLSGAVGVPVASARQGTSTVVVGSAFDSLFGGLFGSVPYVARYRADGRLDRTFADDGSWLLPFDGATLFTSVTVGPDGSIYAAGSGLTSAFVMKFDADGRLDETWGTDGVTGFDTSGSELSKVVVTTSGDGVLLTFAGPDGLETLTRVVRLTAEGVVDAGFGGPTGVSLDTRLGDEGTVASMVAGTRVLVVTTDISSTVVTALRVSDGQPDTTWGSAGQRVLSVGERTGFVRDATVDPRGRLVLLGSSIDESVWQVVRLGAGGAVDRGFAGDGRAELDLGDRGPSAIVAVGGGYAIAGSDGRDTQVARIDGRGDLVLAFGTGGVASTRVALPATTGNDVTVDDQRRVLVAGSAFYSESDTEATVWRLTSDGRRDTTFGRRGVLRVRVDGRSVSADAVHVLDDGRILVAMTMTTEARTWTILGRYTADGRPDPTFGPRGRRVLVPSRLRPQRDLFLDVDAAGRAVIAADSLSGFDIVRVRPNGTIDERFGTDGIVSVASPEEAESTVAALRVLPSGQIAVVDSGALRMVRRAPGGGPVTGFGPGGVQPLLVGTEFVGGAAAITRNGGAVILDGGFESTELMVAKVGPTGLPVDDFGTVGTVTVPVAGDLRLLGSDVAVRPDGGVVLVGTSAMSVFDLGSSRASAVRLLPDGTPDPAFSGDGIAPVPVVSGAASTATALVVAGRRVLVLGAPAEFPSLARVVRLVQ